MTIIIILWIHLLDQKVCRLCSFLKRCIVKWRKFFVENKCDCWKYIYSKSVCVQWWDIALWQQRENSVDGIQGKKLVFINFIITEIPDSMSVINFELFSRNKTFKDALIQVWFIWKWEKKESIYETLNRNTCCVRRLWKW